MSDTPIERITGVNVAAVLGDAESIELRGPSKTLVFDAETGHATPLTEDEFDLESDLRNFCGDADIIDSRLSDIEVVDVLQGIGVDISSDLSSELSFSQ